MNLPNTFLENIKTMFKEEEYDEFIKSFYKKRFYGLRVNTLKISVEEFLKISPFKLIKIPWTEDGFYFEENESPGKHPYYLAGLYYIQEPSAMFPGNVLDSNKGERVLDLCAAPGGKSVQLAAGLKGEGLLVSNDISFNRVKALVKNIELYGVKNAIVTNDNPEKLAKAFFEYFDKILVDAPCSGEGMFRKGESAIKSYLKYDINEFVKMQEQILESSNKMLKPGGQLLYSTCTFNANENERMIKCFKDKYNYTLVSIPKLSGIENGRMAWGFEDKELEKTARLWPHKLDGEGHFVALLKKGINNSQNIRENINNIKNNKSEDLEKELEPFYEFVKNNFNFEFTGELFMKGKNLYHLPIKIHEINTIKVAKQGWFLGQIEKNRFTPSHSLILPLKKEDLKNTISFDSNSIEVKKYLKGETLMVEGTKGFVGVLVDGYSLGWGKFQNGMLKNLFSPTWRI